jgi:hypothetical protein
LKFLLGVLVVQQVELEAQEHSVMAVAEDTHIYLRMFLQEHHIALLQARAVS